MQHQPTALAAVRSEVFLCAFAQCTASVCTSTCVISLGVHACFQHQLYIALFLKKNKNWVPCVESAL